MYLSKILLLVISIVTNGVIGKNNNGVIGGKNDTRLKTLLASKENMRKIALEDMKEVAQMTDYLHADRKKESFILSSLVKLLGEEQPAGVCGDKWEDLMDFVERINVTNRLIKLQIKKDKTTQMAKMEEIIDELEAMRKELTGLPPMECRKEFKYMAYYENVHGNMANGTVFTRPTTISQTSITSSFKDMCGTLVIKMENAGSRVFVNSGRMYGDHHGSLMRPKKVGNYSYLEIPMSQQYEAPLFWEQKTDLIIGNNGNSKPTVKKDPKKSLCDPGWMYFARPNGLKVCHFLSKEQQKHADAKKKCEDMGAVLSGFTTLAEHAMLYAEMAAKFKDPKAAYIGAYRVPECLNKKYKIGTAEIGFNPVKGGECSRDNLAAFDPGNFGDAKVLSTLWLNDDKDPQYSQPDHQEREIYIGLVHGQHYWFPRYPGTGQLNDFVPDTYLLYFCQKNAKRQL